MSRRNSPGFCPGLVRDRCQPLCLLTMVPGWILELCMGLFSLGEDLLLQGPSIQCESLRSWEVLLLPLPALSMPGSQLPPKSWLPLIINSCLSLSTWYVRVHGILTILSSRLQYYPILGKWKMTSRECLGQGHPAEWCHQDVPTNMCDWTRVPHLCARQPQTPPAWVTLSEMLW